MLYLENSLTPDVFTPSRITVLKLLASSAAVSLENTGLYSDLQEREARVRRLVDSNIVGVLIWTVDGRILEANDAFLEMLQYSREDVSSGQMRWTDVTPPEWREQDERAIAKLTCGESLTDCARWIDTPHALLFGKINSEEVSPR